MPHYQRGIVANAMQDMLDSTVQSTILVQCRPVQVAPLARSRMRQGSTLFFCGGTCDATTCASREYMLVGKREHINPFPFSKEIHCRTLDARVFASFQ